MIIRNILLIFTCLSCVSQKEHLNTSFSHQLTIAESLLLPLDTLSGTYAPTIQVYSTHEEDLLFVNDRKCRCINVYDLKRKILLHKISLSKEGPDKITGNAIGMYVKSIDSIFIYSLGVPKVYLITQKGNIINVFDLPDGDPETKVGYHSYPVVTTSSPMFLNGHKLYINTYNIDNVKDHTKVYTCIELDINTGKLNYLFPRPAFYNSGNWGFAAFRTTHYFIYDNDSDSFIISHGNMHNLIIENISGHQSEVFAGSNYIGDLSPISKDRKSFIDELETRRHEVRTGNYTSIISDPYRKVFYRLVTLPIPENKQDKYKPGDLKSIIILDKEFKKIGEHLIPGGYDYSMNFVTEEGLHIFNKQKYEAGNEDYLIFDVFKLTQNN
ncbi:MAG TPA: DUF4221 family protein [Cyclobacteriaceae bacterium]|nr:DUF4221 family protein [Cyclobacteriaceae bacterium]